MWGWVLLSFVVLTISFLSLLPPRSWYFRVWLYGYRQLGWLHLSLLCSSFLFVFGWIWILTFLHAGFVVWITRHIYPYWSFSSKEVADCNRDAEEEHVRMLFANVLQSNENIDRFRQLIHYYQPDLVFAVETDRRWSEALTAEPGYDWQVACPLDNLYGMTLISRLPTIKPVILCAIRRTFALCRARYAKGTPIQVFGLTSPSSQSYRARILAAKGSGDGDGSSGNQAILPGRSGCSRWRYE